MIYFCADDYGMSAEANSRIENCLKNGVLNKVSVLPNGETEDFKKRLEDLSCAVSLHINLVEGPPISPLEDVDLLVSKDGFFKYSFVGLFLLSFSPKRKAVEKQIYKEIQSQIRFWKDALGEKTNLSIDSHQHTHMIPFIFKILMRVIEDEGLRDCCVRFPAEPLSPYILSPSLYFEYSPQGIVKQWLLKSLAAFNRKEVKKAKVRCIYFMGVMFSGKVTERRIKKLLPHYLKLAEKNNKDIEIGFHPGYFENDEKPICGYRKDFGKFYFSPWRKVEYDTLINFKF